MNSFFELCCDLEDQSYYDSDYSSSMDSIDSDVLT